MIYSDQYTPQHPVVFLVSSTSASFSESVLKHLSLFPACDTTVFLSLPVLGLQLLCVPEGSEISLSSTYSMVPSFPWSVSSGDLQMMPLAKTAAVVTQEHFPVPNCCRVFCRRAQSVNVPQLRYCLKQMSPFPWMAPGGQVLCPPTGKLTAGCSLHLHNLQRVCFGWWSLLLAVLSSVG